jgi:hypothetical protein
MYCTPYFNISSLVMWYSSRERALIVQIFLKDPVYIYIYIYVCVCVCVCVFVCLFVCACVCLHVKYPLLLSCLMKHEFSRQIFEKCLNFMKIRPVGVEFHAGVC